MTEENSMSNWFQDNLRIIISVGIVILLVFAIYSYSKRNSRTDVVVDDSQVEEVAMTTTEDSNEINEIIDEITDEEQQDDAATTEEEVVTEEVDTTEDAEQLALEQKIAEEEAMKQEEAARMAEEAQKAEEEQKVAEEQEEERQVAKDAIREVIESRSRQKDGVITVIANSGDSATTLARKAATQYISQNNVSGLTSAHKIYIEDYLRKSVRAQSIHPGTTVEHTEAMIAQAIEQSRSLTDAQLQNLDKYAQNVTW